MTVTVTMDGPLFDGNVENIILSSLLELEYDIEHEAEKKLKQMFQPQPLGELKDLAAAGGVRGSTPSARGSTGDYSKSIHTFVQNLMLEIEDSGAVYGPWLEGESSRNNATRFKGYAIFRRVMQWLEEEYIPKATANCETLISNRLNA